MCSFVKVLCVLSSCTVLAMTAHVTVPRLRSAAVFRPGATLTRPWTSRVSHPYTAYRPVRQYATYRRTPQGLRPSKLQPVSGLAGQAGYTSLWRTSRPPAPMPFTSKYELMRPASAHAPMIIEIGGQGAIHTIPAPNLSLSEKPIVVEDTSTYAGGVNAQAKKPGYEVTENLSIDVTTARPGPVTVRTPHIGFSRSASLTPSQLAALVQSGTLQLVDYVPPAIAIPHTHYVPQYSAQGAFDAVIAAPLPMVNEDFLSQGVPFKPDHLFLQNIPDGLYQNYPMEFVPHQLGNKAESNSEFQVYLSDDEATLQKEAPQESHKNVIRNTQESFTVTTVPKVMEAMNGTEESTKANPVAVTIDAVASETQLPTTTISHAIQTTTKKDKTTPIYFAQIGRTVEDTAAKGFYSAINEVRAAAALAQVEKTKTEDEVSNVTSEIPEVKLNHAEKAIKKEKNSTISKDTFIRGVPFSKAESTDVAYTFLRAEDKGKVTKDGAVYAGQIVEAAVMDDRNSAGTRDSLAVRAPLRLMMVEDNRDVTNETSESTAAKTKTLSKSKIINDAKTGEPVVRIFASYVDNSPQKEVNPKLNMIHKDTAKKHEILENGKEGNVKNLDRTHTGSDVNQVTELGVKLVTKLDDYTSIFEHRDRK